MSKWNKILIVLRHVAIAIMALGLAAESFGAHIKVDFEDFGLTSLSNRQVTLQLIGLNTDNGRFVSLETKVRTTDVNGSTTFSNCLSGVYQATLASTPKTQFWLDIPSTNGVVVAGDYVGTSLSLAGNVLGYTRAQIDAMQLGVGQHVAAGTGITAATNGAVVTVSVYSAPTITAFTNNLNIVEIGTTNTQTVLGWTLGGGDITSQSLNQSIGSLAIGLRTYTHTNTYSTDRTYTLTVTDGTTPAVANTTVSFQNKIFWGASAQTSLTDAQITNTLSAAFATTWVQSRSITADNSYLYFAWPTSFGTPNFKVDTFDDDGWTLVTRSFVNSSGHPSSYDIYRHTEIFLGGTYDVTVEAE